MKNIWIDVSIGKGMFPNELAVIVECIRLGQKVKGSFWVGNGEVNLRCWGRKIQVLAELIAYSTNSASSLVLLPKQTIEFGDTVFVNTRQIHCA